jgi:hypothetical protein
VLDGLSRLLQEHGIAELRSIIGSLRSNRT